MEAEGRAKRGDAAKALSLLLGVGGAERHAGPGSELVDNFGRGHKPPASAPVVVMAERDRAAGPLEDRRDRGGAVRDAASGTL
jgi:hypothetical protein